MTFVARLNKVLYEADIGRRDFMKRTGGTLISLLISKGLNQEIVKQIVKLSNCPQTTFILSSRTDILNTGPIDIIQNAIKVLQSLQKLWPMGKPKFVSDDHDMMSFCTKIDSRNLGKLLSQPGVEILEQFDEDGVLSFEIFLNIIWVVW